MRYRVNIVKTIYREPVPGTKEAIHCESSDRYFTTKQEAMDYAKGFPCMRVTWHSQRVLTYYNSADEIGLTILEVPDA